MSENIDLIVSHITKLSREQFDELLGKLSDVELNYLVKVMKSYRQRYPYLSHRTTNFN